MMYLALTVLVSSSIVFALESTTTETSKKDDYLPSDTRESAQSESSMDTLEKFRSFGNPALQGTGGVYPRSVYDHVKGQKSDSDLSHLLRQKNGYSSAFEQLLQSPFLSASNYYKPFMEAYQSRNGGTPISGNNYESNSVGSLQIGEKPNNHRSNHGYGYSGNSNNDHYNNGKSFDAPYSFNYPQSLNYPYPSKSQGVHNHQIPYPPYPIPSIPHGYFPVPMNRLAFSGPSQPMYPTQPFAYPQMYPHHYPQPSSSTRAYNKDHRDYSRTTPSSTPYQPYQQFDPNYPQMVHQNPNSHYGPSSTNPFYPSQHYGNEFGYSQYPNRVSNSPTQQPFSQFSGFNPYMYQNPYPTESLISYPGFTPKTSDSSSNEAEDGSRGVSQPEQSYDDNYKRKSARIGILYRSSSDDMKGTDKTATE